MLHTVVQLIDGPVCNGYSFLQYDLKDQHQGGGDQCHQPRGRGSSREAQRPAAAGRGRGGHACKSMWLRRISFSQLTLLNSSGTIDIVHVHTICAVIVCCQQWNSGSSLCKCSPSEPACMILESACHFIPVTPSSL